MQNPAEIGMHIQLSVDRDSGKVRVTMEVDEGLLTKGESAVMSGDANTRAGVISLINKWLDQVIIRQQQAVRQKVADEIDALERAQKLLEKLA